jgi:hypothetical protein
MRMEFGIYRRGLKDGESLYYRRIRRQMVSFNLRIFPEKSGIEPRAALLESFYL